MYMKRNKRLLAILLAVILYAVSYTHLITDDTKSPNIDDICADVWMEIQIWLGFLRHNVIQKMMQIVGQCQHAQKTCRDQEQIPLFADLVILRLAEIECAVKPEQWYEDSRDIDKVSGKAHPWNIDIEESILNEANRLIQDTDDILSSQVAAHGFLHDFCCNGILPAEKQKHIDRPDKIWPVSYTHLDVYKRQIWL